MGIHGLLPLLKSVTEPSHAKLYAQQTLGVDGYVWLHRGAIACAQDLALGKPTTKYVDYAMRRILMLKHHGVKPYIVLDGDYLPSKAKTEKERESRRAENARQGKAAMELGNTKAAQEFFQKAIDVTPEMALRLILALQKNQIDYVVAPYEADAQLAYLEKINMIEGIITEDSDLLVFGCKKILLKMNEFGECMEISRARLPETTAVSFNGWNDDMFRYMAILSGCDYLSSLPGIGIKKAHKLVRMYKTIDRLIRGLRSSFGLSFPPDYEESFRRADHTFTYQRVFCPLKNLMVTWNDPLTPLDETSQRLIGRQYENSVAIAVADGSLNPITKEKIILLDLDEVCKLQAIRPGLKHSKSAPVGNQSIDEFMIPSKHIKALQPRDNNIQHSRNLLKITPRKMAPRPSERDLAHAKKLKLFESSPDRLQSDGSTSAALLHGKAETKAEVSSFFEAKVVGAKMKSADREAKEMAAAIEASKADEAARQLFEGFQNPIGFEVLALQESTEKGDDQLSSHYFGDHDFATVKEEHPGQAAVENEPLDLGLPSPPDSQPIDTLILGWKAAYEHKETPRDPPATSKALAPLFSSSLRRLGGQALARQSSSPLMREALRQPFTPDSMKRKSQSQQTSRSIRFFR